MDLGDRMKMYEDINRNYLTKRLPCIIRIDGKAFHTFTRGFNKPFDNILMKTMQETMLYLVKNIQGCKLGYTQSDEISLLLIDYDNLETQAWFDKNIQKMVSISASMTTMIFNKVFINTVIDAYSDLGNALDDNKYTKRYNTALFDSRVFIIPKEEVCNYFIWRQQDATKNSMQMVARTQFSDKELYKKNWSDMNEMLFQKGINFDSLPIVQKRGCCATREGIDFEIPIFTQDREYIEKYI